MAALLVPIMILNFFSGIVGGIWLALLGYWSVLIAGIGLSVIGSFAISIILLPSIFLLAPFMLDERRLESRLAVIPIGALSCIYIFIVMGMMAIAIFYLFSHQVKSDAKFPLILWCYSSATGIWSYMAQQESKSGNDNSSISAFFNQLGCISLMIYTYLNFQNMNVWAMIEWFGVPMTLGLVIQVWMLVVSMDRRV